MNRYADIDALLRSSSHAFHDAVRAALTGDREHAGAVLAGSQARHDLARAAEETLRERTWVPAPQLARELQLISGIVRVATVTDRLAAQVVMNPEPPGPWLALELTVLLDTGDRRFRQLLDTGSTATLDPSSRGCAARLFEVADHSVGDASPTAALCGVLATALLQVSRQAAAA
ncbi:hypothetical protein KV097_10375 [Mumia sp. zg.B17]|uniref:hypothetical protein n=1 Tax=Mumia sp. zg.B17 TaxID=2855446 RepID=UPI001C6EA790|nr:hypothetical protein [Mumia sp. zg.B17]MBW9206351.1 hypothetical protein [Mumia sp. zg.B17]